MRFLPKRCIIPLGISLFVFVILIHLSRVTHPPLFERDNLPTLTQVDCLYAKKHFNNCYILDGHQVLLPLQLVTSGFELSGEVDIAKKPLHLRLTGIDLPTMEPEIYRTNGKFLFLHKYSVEYRPHVLVVTADEGIPLSTQWDKRGYPYPIQIAQFGLSHHGKLAGLPSTPPGLPDERTEANLLWEKLIHGLPRKAFYKLYSDSPNWQKVGSTNGRNVYRFSGCVERMGIAGDESPVRFAARPSSNWDFLLVSGHNWTIGSQIRVNVFWSADKRRHEPRKTLIYTCNVSSNLSTYLTVSRKEWTATFWMPTCARSSSGGFKVTLARDLRADLVKAFASVGNRSLRDADDQPAYSSPVLVQTIDFHAGSCDPKSGGFVDSLRTARQTASPSSLTESAFHRNRFLAASDWLVRHLDSGGGWRVPVERKLLNGQLIIPAKWYSAMGQGHAISLLLRAFQWSKDEVYLKTASKAVLVYNRTVREDGVQSHFLGNPELPWYEEYPSDPGNHVLNGFMYSLFGLYDFIQVAQHHHAYAEQANLAQNLLSRGLHSLSTLLPLFDSGTGSFYDLRHVTLAHVDGRGGPMRARWSYHKLHVQLLLELAGVYKREEPEMAQLWRETARRWTAYMAGHRSAHN